MTPGEALLIGALVTFGVLASVAALGSAVWIWTRTRRSEALIARGLRAMADSLDTKEMGGAGLRALAAQAERGPAVAIPSLLPPGKPRTLRPLTDAEEGALEERRRGADLADPDRKRRNERIVAGIRQEEAV